jgi:hypothetical protein
MLLPPDLDELIDGSHPVRVINAVLDSRDIDKITRYRGVKPPVITPACYSRYWYMPIPAMKTAAAG